MPSNSLNFLNDSAFLENGFNFSLRYYIFELLIYVVCILAFLIISVISKKYILQKLQSWSQKTKGSFDDKIVEKIETIGPAFYISLGIFTATNLIQLNFNSLPALLSLFLKSSSLVVISWYLAEFIDLIIIYLLGLYITQKNKTGARIDKSIINVSHVFVRFGVWFFALTFGMQILGFNVTTLVAGLGIGGVAIALALQGILSDIFSSISIYFDKPFVAGEWINFKGKLGIVKKVGLKSTRVYTDTGEEMIISNKLLTEEVTYNISRAKSRRTYHEIYFDNSNSNQKLDILKTRFIEFLEKQNYILDFTFTLYKIDLKGKQYLLNYNLDSYDWNLYLIRTESILSKLSHLAQELKIEFSNGLPKYPR